MAYTIDPGYYGKLQRIEDSSGDPNARNPSGAWGLFQFMPSTAKKYGVAYGTASPSEQLAGVQRFTNDNAKSLDAAGIPVNNGTLYLAHQQGASGAAYAMRHPDAPLTPNMVSNIPKQMRGQITNAGQFANYWINRMNGMGDGSGAGAAIASSAANSANFNASNGQTPSPLAPMGFGIAAQNGTGYPMGFGVNGGDYNASAAPAAFSGDSQPNVEQSLPVTGEEGNYVVQPVYPEA